MVLRAALAAGACALAVATSGCGALAPELPRERPFVLVLGTAQDGGLPQIGCREAACEAARADPTRARFASSILLVDPRTGGRWLFDATPDLREQVEAARSVLEASAARHGSSAAPAGGTAPRAAGRPPLFDAIFLTHAHLGHVGGLAWLGREAYAAAGQRVIGSARTSELLASAPPWSVQVAAGHLAPEPIEPGVPRALAPDLTVTALRVPHRDELSDTLAFVVRGPSRALLYLPDIDKWERWERRIEDVLSEVDVALVDGTFFADGEVAGRSMAEIPHPFVQETMARLAPLAAAERAKVRFLHLNHTNPAADPASDAAASVRAAGMAIAREGEIHEL